MGLGKDYETVTSRGPQQKEWHSTGDLMEIPLLDNFHTVLPFLDYV